MLYSLRNRKGFKTRWNKKNVRKPVINSLLFFHSETYIAKEIQKILTDKVILYTRQIDFKKIPLAIPEREMNIFMLVTSSGEKGLEYFDTDNPKFYQGDHVKVIDGTFKGAEGYICRIKKEPPAYYNSPWCMCCSHLLYSASLLEKNTLTTYAFPIKE